MRFSVAFEAEQPLRYFEPIRLAKMGGLYSVQIYEHLPNRPAWPLVFYAAVTCDTVRIGPVTVPVFLYPPEQMARYVRFLLELCEAGAVVGVSRGAYWEMMEKKPSRSRRDVVEYVRRLSMLLADVPRERLQLLVGTSGPKLAAEAASLPRVDGIVVDSLWSPKYGAMLRRVIDEACESCGRQRDDVELIARPYLVFLDDEGGLGIAQHLAKTILRIIGPSAMLDETDLSKAEPVEIVSETQFKRLFDRLVAVGTPSEIMERARAMREAGVGHVVFGVPSMRLAAGYLRKVVSMTSSATLKP